MVTRRSTVRFRNEAHSSQRLFEKDSHTPLACWWSLTAFGRDSDRSVAPHPQDPRAPVVAKEQSVGTGLARTAEAASLDSVGIGEKYAFQLAALTDTDLRRMAELVRRYADRHLAGTDASLIAACERLAIVTVATVNLRDFANVRPRHVAALAIVS